MKKRNKKYRGLTDLFLNNYPTSSRFAEAYRTLRTNVHFAFMDKPFRSILISSAGEKEGKTSTVANLAFTLSQTGKSVLMIDADLRKPILSDLSASQESSGVSGLLSNLFGTDAVQGTLDDFGIGDMVNLFSLQKRTGLLQISDENEEVGLYFLQGKLVNLRWFTRPVARNLVNFLVKTRLLSRQDALSALGRQKNTGKDLGFILINMGLLGREELKGALNIHTMETIQIALQMKTGSFSFKSLPESDIDRSLSELVDIHQLYREAVSGDEAQPYLQKEIQSAIVNIAENLFLLPSGHLPPNPSELLGSERMSFLLSYLKQKFDVLIIDTPPILPATDALLLAPQTDGVILVVKTGSMNRELVKKATEQLRLAKANLLGVVLNQVNVKRESYYKYYHKYYSGYYGEDVTDSKKKSKKKAKKNKKEEKASNTAEKQEKIQSEAGLPDDRGEKIADKAATEQEKIQADAGVLDVRSEEIVDKSATEQKESLSDKESQDVRSEEIADKSATEQKETLSDEESKDESEEIADKSAIEQKETLADEESQDVGSGKIADKSATEQKEALADEELPDDANSEEAFINSLAELEKNQTEAKVQEDKKEEIVDISLIEKAALADEELPEDRKEEIPSKSATEKKGFWTDDELEDEYIKLLQRDEQEEQIVEEPEDDNNEEISGKFLMLHNRFTDDGYKSRWKHTE